MEKGKKVSIKIVAEAISYRLVCILKEHAGFKLLKINIVEYNTIFLEHFMKVFVKKKIRNISCN